MKDIFTKKDKRTELEKEYDNAVKLLGTEIPGTDAYELQLKNVERIHALVMAEKGQKKQVSPDALLTGVVALVQVAAVLKHEELHNITSKAMNFILKGKVR